MGQPIPKIAAEDARLFAQIDQCLRTGQLDAAEAALRQADLADPRVALRLIRLRLRGDRPADAEALAPAFLQALTPDLAAEALPDLWREARQSAAAGSAEAASLAARLAADLLDRHDVLARVPLQALLEGLNADSQSEEGRWTLPILAEILAREPQHPTFFIKFLSGLGGSRPHLGGKRRLDVLAERARALPAEASPALHNAAALLLFAAQDASGAQAEGRAAPPGSIGAQAGADAGQRLAVSAALRQAALAPRGRVVPRDEPPYIVVHKGGQDYVALCAASLALQNGANNVVLLGDQATARIGIGRQAAIAEYFEAAAAFAPSYIHHAVSEPTYGLFSFQRWLVVEEFCRKNRIDQCVVIDSDALAFSPASEIIAAMPPGFAMNDWTWTTTVRDTRGLSQLADHLREIYARPREEVLALVGALGRTVAGQSERSFQDMHMFYSFRDRFPDVMFSQYERPFHGGLDQAATLANGVELGSPGDLAPLVLGRPLKRPYLVDGQLGFRATADGRMVRFHTVHCQGPAKAMMHRYAALLLPGAEAEIAAWRSAPAPVAAPAPAPVTAPDLAGRPLPNLRTPEHAALRERLRAAVAALGPLNVAIELRLPRAEIAAGQDLPVEVVLRNEAAHTLPTQLLGHAALSIGFQLTARGAAGPRRVGEPRLAAPPLGLPAGQTLTVRADLPAARLAPGEYELNADLVYEYVRWFRKDPAARPSAAFRVVAAAPEPDDPTDPRTHLRHVASLNPAFDNGIEALGETRFRIHRRAGAIEVRSQMHEREIALLHMLASRAIEGRGDIADLGPLLGIGTCAMARGLAANPHPAARARRIVSYDMWRLGFVRSFLGAEVPPGSPDDFSLLPMFEATNADHLERIVRIPGDLTAQAWIGGPIELLFVDVATSVGLMEHIARVFYPALLPGAWIVHQDFVHPDCWWLHVATGLMLDRLDYLYAVPWSSALFRLRDALPPGWSLPPIAPLPLAEKREAIGRVRDIMRPGGERMMMDLVEACCLLAHGDRAGAASLLAGVDPGRCAPDDAFRRLLASTRQQVARRVGPVRAPT